MSDAGRARAGSRQPYGRTRAAWARDGPNEAVRSSYELYRGRARPQSSYEMRGAGGGDAHDEPPPGACASPGGAKRQRVSSAPRGEAYRVNGAGGADAVGGEWCFDMVSVGKCDVVRVRLLRMCDLRDGDERECPIGACAFNEAGIDCLPEGTPFLPPPNEDRCIAVLPCGHAFGALPLMYHAVVQDMRCPICRAGMEKAMRPSCLPVHIRGPIWASKKRLKDEDRANDAERDAGAVHAMLMSEGGLEFGSLGQEMGLILERLAHAMGSPEPIFSLHVRTTLDVRMTAFLYGAVAPPPSSPRGDGAGGEGVHRRSPSGVRLATRSYSHGWARMVASVDFSMRHVGVGGGSYYLASSESLDEIRGAFRHRQIGGVRFIVYSVGGDYMTSRIGRTTTLSAEDLQAAATPGGGAVRLECSDDSGALGHAPVVRGHIEMEVHGGGVSGSTRAARSSGLMFAGREGGTGMPPLAMDRLRAVRWCPLG